jgi:predicted DNA-binding protein
MRNKNDRDFSVKLRDDILQRLRLESARKGEYIREIVEHALDSYLPEMKITITKPGADDRRRAKSEETA